MAVESESWDRDKVSQGIATGEGGWGGGSEDGTFCQPEPAQGNLTGLERSFLPTESQRGNTFVSMTHLYFSGDHVIVFALGSREWKIPPASSRH